MDAVTEARYSEMRANLQAINTSGGIIECDDGELLSLGRNTYATQNDPVFREAIKTESLLANTSEPVTLNRARYDGTLLDLEIVLGLVAA